MPTYDDKTGLSLDDARSKLAGLHFAQESLTYSQREILHIAEAVLRMYDAATQEIEQLTRERDAYKRAKQENDERFMTERDEARAECEKLRQLVMRSTSLALDAAALVDEDDAYEGRDFRRIIAAIRHAAGLGEE